MRVATVVAGALVLASSALAAPPKTGILDPGRSLGGLGLGASRADVTAAWGRRYGVCRGCRKPTWYFNYRPFQPEGAGVAFRRGRVVALFTTWAPAGWRTRRGLRIGEPAARVAALHGPLVRVNCGTYYAVTARTATALTAIYIQDERVWGFGLLRRALSPCL